jgi:uncharacterized membrane protein YccC
VNLDNFKEFCSKIAERELPTGAGVLAGLVLLYFVFKTSKFFMKVMLILVAAALFFGAFWWYQHHR